LIVVFDSGVWISALRFAGAPLEAINSAAASQQIAICDGIVNEVCRISLKKFGRARAESLRILEPYLESSIRVETTGQLHGICRDPNDDMILECAVLATADLIVTGDRDLLILGAHGEIRIITARQYLGEYA
jgi:putative PIN family toxin of toxin-antitoxin system